MPAPASAGAAGEVLAEAERIVREEQDRELERGRREARRKALKAERQRRVREERERKAAEQRERDEQLRAAADGQRLAMLERIRERGQGCGGSVTDRVFAGVPDPRDPRGVRHSLSIAPPTTPGGPNGSPAAAPMPMATALPDSSVQSVLPLPDSNIASRT